MTSRNSETGFPERAISAFIIIIIIIGNLQSVQNAAARLVTGAHQSDHITPVLRQLHWLPVTKVIGTLVFQSLTGQAPVYLADECRLVSDSHGRQLRSANIPTCECEVTEVPTAKDTKSFR